MWLIITIIVNRTFFQIFQRVYSEIHRLNLVHFCQSKILKTFGVKRFRKNDKWCKIEKEERCNFAVNGNYDSRIEIGNLKNSTGNQFVVSKMSEWISKFFYYCQNLPHFLHQTFLTLQKTKVMFRERLLLVIGVHAHSGGWHLVLKFWRNSQRKFF